jgi:hypothetical protein
MALQEGNIEACVVEADGYGRGTCCILETREIYPSSTLEDNRPRRAQTRPKDSLQ